MPDRKPLVNVGGVLNELPGGDRLGSLLPAIAPGQPRTFEQDDPSVVIDMLAHCISIIASSVAPYVWGAINTGTFNLGNGAAIDNNRPFAIKLRSSATANSGASLLVGQCIKVVKPTLTYGWINFNLLTGTTIRLGLHTSTSNVAPTDGCYWEIVGSTITAKVTNNSITSQLTGTPPTPTLGATDWYRFDVNVVPDPITPANSTAQFIMRDRTSTILFTETLTGVNIPTTRLVSAGVIATNSGTAVNDLCHLNMYRTIITNVSR